jgi:hypothetical protein
MTSIAVSSSRRRSSLSRSRVCICDTWSMARAKRSCAWRTCGRAAVIHKLQLTQAVLDAHLLALRLLAQIARRDRVDQENRGDDDRPADEKAHARDQRRLRRRPSRMNRVPSSDFRNSRCSGRCRSSIAWMRVVSREFTVSASCPQFLFFCACGLPGVPFLVPGTVQSKCRLRDQAVPGDRTT